MKKKLLQMALFSIMAFCFCNNAMGQVSKKISISGQVTASEDGLPIAGVNILENGTNNGTVTDFDGNYTITVESNAQLVVSYLGYKTQTIKASGSTLNIVLEADITALDDVVVVGYGSQRKKDVTGAVVSISGDELTSNPLPGIDQALQGKLSGVTIINNSGEPGGGVSVRIRGEGTIGNSDPLYVIDGVPIVNNVNSEIPVAGGSGKVSNPLANLNPNDIESIDILKDASSAAIYGVRGANGVIIITTKKGKKGAPQFTFDNYLAIQNVKTIDLLKARDYADLIIEMFDNAGEAIDDVTEPTNLLDDSFVVDRADWQKEFFKTGITHNYNINISGGNEFADYSLSGGYHKDNATTPGAGFKRYSTRLNSNFKLGKFKFGEAVFFSRTVNRRSTFQAARSQIRIINRHAPTVAVYNPANEGGFNGPGEGDGYNRWNPIGLAELTDNVVRRNRFVGNLYGEYEIVKGLKYRLNVGLDAVFTNGSTFIPRYVFSEGQSQEDPSLREYSAEELSPLIENTLNFQKDFGNHNLDLLVGFTQQEYKFSRFSAFSNMLQSNNLQTLNTSSASAQISIAGFDDEWAIRSLLGRVNYNYKEKYLFTGNIRRDGSSRFSEANRYGVFPSFSVGWVLSEEKFLNDHKFINNLKLRFGWGELGNQEIPPYGFQSSLFTSANYVFGGNLQSGITQNTLANENLKWETTVQKNIGLDLTLFDYRLNMTLEYFIKDTEDIILRAPLPGSIGITELPLINAGNIQNRGLEILASYKGSAGDLNYELSANASFLKNEVKSLGIGLPLEGRFPDDSGPVLAVIREGEAINSFFGHVTDGIFQNQAEVDAHASQSGAAPGDIRFKDINNDNVINADDRVILGDPNPDITYGLNASFDYKGVDFSLFFQGVEGVDIYNGLRFWNEGMAEMKNHSTAVLNRWTGEGTSNSVPRAILGDPNFNRRPSDRFLEDGSYLRLKNIILGYSFQKNTLSKFADGFIKSLRIYASAQNILTFTNYTGYDPEIGTGFNQGPGVANQGVDYGIVPQPKTFLTGIQIKF
ncbi:SusC/RagA family TonB-linked outer membrane protein [Flagellimonas pacifica]|uniref:TonB-linked outer membrane protein, SusC/RagA family n=1 Tax=Flagellimonas pacifica TaxID=1247520 RepID=A0A285MX30_9FLAO|nr:TonB-dependent receptor [Allomuricauda parva]SNZ01749.1 TonB-linked outer membrane protein, SusC/RagA family [Allomuricauda parva]